MKALNIAFVGNCNNLEFGPKSYLKLFLSYQIKSKS